MKILSQIALAGLLSITPASWAVDQPHDLLNPAPPITSSALIDDLPDNFPQVERLPVFMWVIEKNGHRAHLVGSLHMGTDDMYPLPRTMLDAFAASEYVTFEVDPSAMNEVFRKKLHDAGHLPKGQILRDMIPPEMKQQLEATLRRLDAPENATDDLKPWMAALMVTFSATMRHGGDALSMSNGIDRYFSLEAQRNGKKINGLETTDDQLSLFTSLSDDLSIEFLDKTLHELEQLGPLFSRMIDAWKKGDADALWKIVEESFDGYPEVYKQWLVDRNKAWLDKIDTLFETNRTAFIVVGAAHVVGPDGLPELLRARGYHVQQAHE